MTWSNIISLDLREMPRRPLNSDAMPRTEPSRYLYTAWFRDEQAAPEDEDFEWPACFLVVAETEGAAQRWGDQLAASFTRRRGTEVFLWSKIEPAPPNAEALASVEDGHEVSDEEIGW